MPLFSPSSLRRHCHKLALVPTLLLIAGLGIGPAPAQAQSKRAVFDLTIAGVRAGTLSLATAQSEDQYAAATRIDAAGLLGIVTDFGFSGQANGSIAPDGSLIPRKFVADSKSPRADRHTEIDWQEGTPTRVLVEPPRSTAPDPARQGGTLDPVSASYVVLRDAPPSDICGTTIDVFDGSRRSRLQLAAPVATEDGVACDGAYSRLQGEAHSLSDQREYPFRLFFRPAGADLMALDRIETETRIGLAVVERRR